MSDDEKEKESFNWKRTAITAGVSALLALAAAYTAKNYYNDNYKSSPVFLDFDPNVIKPNYVLPLKSPQSFVRELNLHAASATQILKSYPDFSQILRLFYIHRDILLRKDLQSRGNYMNIMENLTLLFLYTIQEQKKTNYFQENKQRVVGTKRILKKLAIFWGNDNIMFSKNIRIATRNFETTSNQNTTSLPQKPLKVDVQKPMNFSFG